MSMFNSIKNNLLLVIFLCAFVVPVGVWGAIDVVGDTSKNINNYVGGSYYSGKNLYTVMDNTGDGKASENLYKGNQKKVNLETYEVEILRKKLETGGSTFNNLKGLTAQNVTVKNTGDVSIFEFDPTPNNVTNNDSLILSAATKGGQFYIAEKPVTVETGTKTSTDSLTANGFLNMIDTIDGREIGTTITAKNSLFNLTQEVKLNQEKVDEAAANRNKTWDDLQTAIKNGAPAEEIARLEKLSNEATKQVSAQAVQSNQTLKQYNEAQARADASAKNTPVEEYKCSIGSPLNCVLWTTAILANIVFKLTSFVAYIAGTLFDYSLELSINSAEFFKKLGVIEITWSFIRDVLNMTFIFILLWTAIQILISNDAKYSAKKILINVIIVAILMNFSLFAAKLMVDGSNVVSLKIYEAMKTNTKDSKGDIVKGASISERVMNTVGLSALYNVSEIFKSNTIQAEGTCANNPVSLITVSVMGSIFLIVLILALGLAAILFLVRLVNIIYLFIKSPLWVWGYVIPGNATMEKLKNDWQSQMKHVLLFPITYLFWMLIAVIIFEKLGTVTKVGESGKGKSLLDLICNPPGSADIGGSISLVAIFIIVIILMMKAIEYGVKHASDGGSDAIGGKFASNMANKFSGYQTAMTKGLSKKMGTMAGNATLGASVGAAKVPLRAVTGIAGGVHSFRNKEGFWKGANDGFSNPGINLKEMASGTLGKAALITGNKTLARKSVELTDKAAKSRKEVEENRVKGVKEAQGNLEKISAKEYKIDTQEQWEKKNGKIDDTAKADEYEKYVEKQIEKRANASLGKTSDGGSIIHRDNKDGVKHLDAIRSKALTREETKDASGKVTSVKFKLNNRDIASGLGEVLKYHTTGDGAKVEGAYINKKGMWKPFRTKKAEARIKAVEAALKAEEGNYSNDQAEKDLDAMIKKTESKLSEIPDDTTLDKTIKDVLSGSSISIDKEILKKHKNLRKLNDLFNEYGRASATRKTAIEFELHDEKENIAAERNKMSEKLIKHKNDLAKKAAAKEKKDKENK